MLKWFRRWRERRKVGRVQFKYNKELDLLAMGCLEGLAHRSLEESQKRDAALLARRSQMDALSKHNSNKTLIIRDGKELTGLKATLLIRDEF